MRFVGRKEDKINIKKASIKRRDGCRCRGKLSIVGIGPGDPSQMSEAARRALSQCDVLMGYSTYLKLLDGIVSGKEVISSGMRQEVARAEEAIRKAREGRSVCVVSSGDPGVYGMAGIVLELLRADDAEHFDCEVIPGIISATACAALLGAPLMNDFAAVSLSDLLTKGSEIEKRICAAARADFVIVLYNPKSRTRTRPLASAWRIIKKYRRPETPVGIVKNAYRSGQTVRIVDLKEASAFADIDMTTTLIVGNSKTRLQNGYMITPRGYPFSKRS